MSNQLLDDAKQSGATVIDSDFSPLSKNSIVFDNEAQLAKFLELQDKRTKPQPTPSQSDDGLLEEWLIKNMPPSTVIGDPKWWAKRIRNVLSYENAQLSKPQPTSQDVVDAVLAEREACAKICLELSTEFNDPFPLVRASNCILARNKRG